jgi:hypothetical protein
MPDFGTAKGADRREGITQTQAGVPGLQEGFQRTTARAGEGVNELLAAKKKLDKIDNDTWLLETVNSYRREARETFGKELSRRGADASGGVDRTRESFDSFSARIGAEAPNEEYANLARQSISGIFNANQDKLSVHGLREIEAGQVQEIARSMDFIAEQVALDGGTPEALEDGLQAGKDMMDLYAENYGQAKAEAIWLGTTESPGFQEFIASEAIKKNIEVDPIGTAEAIQRGDYSEFITTEVRDDLLKGASDQVKINETRAKEAEKVRVEEVNQELFNSFADSTLDINTIKATDMPTKDKTFWENKLIAQAKRPDRFDKSNNPTHADILTRVMLDPENITAEEISKLMGASGDDWLSISDTNALVKQLNTNLKGDGTSQATSDLKNTIKRINADWTDEVYGAGSKANEERSKMMRDLNIWYNDPINEGKSPITWYDEKVRPFKARSYSAALDLLNVFIPKPLEFDVAEGAEQLDFERSQLSQADQVRLKRQQSRFGFDELDVLKNARENEANAGFTDEQIIEAWRITSGG